MAKISIVCKTEKGTLSSSFHYQASYRIKYILQENVSGKHMELEKYDFKHAGPTNTSVRFCFVQVMSRQGNGTLVKWEVLITSNGWGNEIKQINRI